MRCPRCGYTTEKLKQRSKEQNKYYWGVLIATIAEDIGYRIDEHDKVHEEMKTKFLKKYEIIYSKKGKSSKIEYSGSTADLSTKKFEEYCSQIRIWASADLGIWIPESNEVINENI